MFHYNYRSIASVTVSDTEKPQATQLVADQREESSTDPLCHPTGLHCDVDAL